MSYSSKEIREAIAALEAGLRQPGTVLFSQSRYEVKRILGGGGMGITYLADEYSAGNLKRPVVLKFVKDSLDAGRLDQFLNEVQLSILFNHPNLVPMFRLESEQMNVELRRRGAGAGRRRPHQHVIYYAVMQYIDGWNLRQIVNRLKTLKLILNYDVTMFIVGRVARGLQYVHDYADADGVHLGLVHRDVSPENILIDRFARIKVSDFGIALARRRRNDSTLPHVGKLLYCSPEQLEGRRLDHRSDIYNVGLLLYLLLTNTDRFAAETATPDARNRVRSRMNAAVREELEHVDESFVRICEGCLEEDTEKRYQSCEDVANDIDIRLTERGKVVTNEQLEEILTDLFKPDPAFVSRRFIPLTGSAVLEQPGYDPKQNKPPAAPPADVPTAPMEPT